MLIVVSSNDMTLCSELAVMCSNNSFNILFINKYDDLKDIPDCIVLDLDNNIDSTLNECRDYYKNHHMIFGVMSMPTKSNILKAKKAGCLMVLTRLNFSANILDIINRSK